MKPQLTTKECQLHHSKGGGDFPLGLKWLPKFLCKEKKAQSGIYPYQYRSKISNNMAAKRTHPAAHS